MIPAHGLDTTTHIQFSDPDLPDRAKLLRTIEHIPDILKVLDYAHDWLVHPMNHGICLDDSS